jgi:hypothetical protein
MAKSQSYLSSIDFLLLMQVACIVQLGIMRLTQIEVGTTILIKNASLFVLFTTAVSSLFDTFCLRSIQILFISRVQMKSWAGKALETVNCCAFLKRRLIGAC